jgi:AAA domain, putative AbiEii toxin, Type IV TA system
MLEFLNLQDIGPASHMEMTLARRLNLFTGDNGLGKSFLLDVAWWALTRSWARQPVRPTPTAAAPEITSRYTKSSPGPFSSSSVFDRKREKWPVPPGRPPIAGLVLYAQVDGGFSVWDPARNYWKKEAPDRPASFSFTANEIWEGNALCEGLIRDWASWQREDGSAFAELRRVLDALSPGAEEPLQPGSLVKISVDDPKRYPTLAMPYGQDVPVVHASAGMRRIIALAYLLVWAWHEHLAAAALLGDEPATEVIFLIDEIEAHLHPKWQLRIVPALLAVMDKLTGKHGSRVQLIAATHSPLVLASAEPDFDATKDAWFDMDLEPQGKQVILRKREFARMGTAGRWLTSEAFDLRSEGRAPKIEALLEEASHALGDEQLPATAARKLDHRLREVLGDTDPFWIRWRFVGEQRGWLTEAPSIRKPKPAAKPRPTSKKATAKPKAKPAKKAPLRR